MVSDAQVFAPEKVSKSVTQHLEKRQQLISKEKQHRSDDAFRRSLSPVALEACKIVGDIRALEQKTSWNRTKAEDDDFEMYPGMMFSLAKKQMETTKLWKIVERMPKGALLHCHFGATVEVDWIFREALKYPEMYIYASEPLTSQKALANAQFLFGYSNSTPKADPASIWQSGYVPDTWVNAQNAADAFPNGGRDGFISWLHNRCIINEKESTEHHLGVNEVWRKMAAAFPIIGSVTYYEPIYRRFLQKMFRTLLDDGVRWVEVRDAPFDPYRREGQETPDSDFNNMIATFGEEVEKFKASPEGEGFWGARLIWTSVRIRPSEDIIKNMEHCILAKKAHPHVIAGYDLVGQEDLGKTHKELAPEIIWFQERCAQEGVNLPFFFHAGECLGDGDSTDGNLFDAILFGTRRLGHGYSLYKHPELIDLVKEKQILIESCPISNEVLRLTATVLAHPLPALLARGVCASLSNDDPSLLGQGTSGMTHDFWETIQAWENLGLAGLGSLAENSVRWAVYEDQTDEEWRKDIADGYNGSGIRAQRLKEWRASFEEFCRGIVNEFGKAN